jgi:hypothetical protein
MIGRQRFAAQLSRALLHAGALALASVGLLVAALALASSAVAAETEVNFDNLTAGALVTTQYEALGLKLGHAGELGQPPAGLKGDCGAPQVEEGPIGTPIKAASPPNYALLPTCPPSPAAPPFSGTYGALLGAARGALSLEVSNVNPSGSANVPVKLIGYDSAWQEVASGEAEATGGGEWKRIELLVSGADRISYFAIRTTEGSTQTVKVGIDNVRFEAEGSGEKEHEKEHEKEKEKEGEKGGGEKSGGSGSSGGATGGSGSTPPTPPVAALALQGPAQPGAALTLTGAGSQPGSGHIISYDWDLNGDGATDTSTGANPVAHVILPPGPHTIGLTVTSSTGQQSSSKFGVTIPPHIELPPPADGGEGPCEPTLTIGDAQLIAECIQKLPGGGYAIETHQLALNGMVLTPRGGGYGVFKIRTVKDYAIAGTRTQLSGTAVNIELLNTPIGNVVLGGRDLEAEPIDLEVHSGLQNLKVPFVHGLRAHAADDEGAPTKTLLMAIGAGQQCSSSESKHANCCPPAHENTACATLPGDFPLEGQIVIYLNNKGQTLIDAQVGLRLKDIFEATGALEIEADPTGVNLNSLKFTIPEAGLEKIFTVKEASFAYYFPDAPEESKRDTWQAKGTIVFGPLGEPSLEGELAFKHGQFHSASLVFTAPPPGVPLYAGVYLNKLGGSVGVEPFSFGGTIGASIASELELTLSFKYREAEGEELGFIGGQGQLSLKDNPIATLAADVYSDGYVDAQLKIDLKLPFGENPLVSVGGGLGFWDEPASGLWQAEGNVYMKLWEISAEVAGLVNNKFIAGCLNFNTFGYSWGVQGRYGIEDNSVSGAAYGDSNCTDQLKEYKQKPLKEHKGGFVGGESLYFPVGRPVGGLGQLTPGASAKGAQAHVAAAGGEGFSLPAHTLGQELRLTSTSGTPVVTLTSPSGQTYTTPAAPGQMVGDDGHFFSAILPDHNQVVVLLRHPQGGEWGIQTAPGSPAVSKLEVAEEVPPASVSVNVRRTRGHRFALAYKILHHAPGTKVRFVERGRDSTHVLGVVSAARGALRFTPQDALGRHRRIAAYLLNGEGAPVRVLTAGHYTAPGAARGGRVRGARIARHGTTALLTWRPTAGARLYKIVVEGSDGRVQRFDRKAAGRSVTLTNVLPFESFTATIVAEGGPNLLPGPVSKVRLGPLRLPGHRRPTHRHGHKRKG